MPDDRKDYSSLIEMYRQPMDIETDVIMIVPSIETVPQEIMDAFIEDLD